MAKQAYLSVPVDPEFKRKLRELASRQGRTLAGQVRYLLSKALESERMRRSQAHD